MISLATMLAGGFGSRPSPGRRGYSFAFSRRDAPEVLQIVSPSRIQRAQGMPDARCTRGLVSKCAQRVRPRAYRAAENIRHSLRSGFTAYNVLSPENGSFASVAPWEIERLPEALTPAPRRRDHTPLPYASITLVGRNCHVHRIPAPRCDDGQRPSEWDGMRAMCR